MPSIKICFLLLATAKVLGAQTENSTVSDNLRAIDAPSGDRLQPAVLEAQPFPLSSVKLLPGPFYDAMQRDHQTLLELDPDRLLSWFRKGAGLVPKAPVYGGWESMGIAGQTLGHYLTACSCMWQATGDPELLRRVHYIVDELALCQNANGSGYVGAIPNGKKLFADQAAGKDFKAGWVPWYTMHKLFAGLRDACLVCNDDEAGDVLTRLADWAGDVVKNLSDDQMQHQMLRIEHGGMAQALADVYAMTGDSKYLALARRFSDHVVMDPLAQGQDPLTGLHANTQIPKFIGFERIYELTGDRQFHDAAVNFWTTVVQKRTWVIGGNSSNEHFFDAGKTAAEVRAMAPVETCNTYNMLRLTHRLFLKTPTAELMDFYERALFNHILSSQEPAEGGFVYMTPMRPGHFRVYSTKFDSMWCCVDTGLENHARYGEAIYYHDDSRLWVNLFIASELNFSARGLKLRQETLFPEEEGTRLILTLAKPADFMLKLRHPAWVAAGAMQVSVNGRPVAETAAPDGYVNLRRRWETGDVIDVKLPMRLTVEPLPNGDRSFAAVLYGPIVLAGALGTEGLEGIAFHTNPQLLKAPLLPEKETPKFTSSYGDILSHLKPVDGHPLTFRTEGLIQPKDLTLEPFYRIHFQRYALYWEVAAADGSGAPTVTPAPP